MNESLMYVSHSTQDDLSLAFFRTDKAFIPGFREEDCSD